MLRVVDKQPVYVAATNKTQLRRFASRLSGTAIPTTA
jgi:hypothetical protein